MSLYKGVYLLLLNVLIASFSIYYMGCSSAESTTGKLAFNQQDYLKAESELKKGLAIDPKDDEGWYMLGYSQIELGKNDDALNSFKKSLAISNNYADKIKFYWIEKFNDGAKDFKNGIDAEEKKDKAGAKVFYENALSSFEASYAIFPDSLKSLSAMGETYLALGQNEKALEILNEIASKTHSPEAAMKVAKILFESGLSMMQTKNYLAAITTFKKIQSISTLPKDDPYYETAAYNTGLALAKMGEDMRTQDENSNYKEKYSEALTYLEPLTVSLKNKDIQTKLYELIVTVYANLGMTEKAQDALNKKESLNSNK
ncbi:MAG: tetratricopeptide repeat protein [bacterium]